MSDQQGIKSLKGSSSEEIGSALARGLEPLLGIQPNVDVTALMEEREGMGLAERVRGAKRFRVEFLVTTPTRDLSDEEGLEF